MRGAPVLPFSAGGEPPPAASPSATQFFGLERRTFFVAVCITLTFGFILVSMVYSGSSNVKPRHTRIPNTDKETQGSTTTTSDIDENPTDDDEEATKANVDDGKENTKNENGGEEFIDLSDPKYALSEDKPIILVTGGAGFIGSHTCVELLAAGFSVVVVDNYNNSKEEALLRVKALAGSNAVNLVYFKCDLRNKELLRKIVANYKIYAVIHFAGFKAVGESVQFPLRYYNNNLMSTVILLEVMQDLGLNKIVFSSSSTVYGAPESSPILETAPLQPVHPYGWTKRMLEQVITDWCKSVTGSQAIFLRYFNPIGAHPSGRIGEDPQGIPNNLMPYITQVAVGTLPFVKVFGNDYNTKDGTGERDYIHVVDVAQGHISALNYFKKWKQQGAEAFNLGLGRGYSVMEVITEMRNVTGLDIPIKIMPRRLGDIASYFCDPSKAEKEMGWKAKYNLKDMCTDAWNFQRQNPKGYITDQGSPSSTTGGESHKRYLEGR